MIIYDMLGSTLVNTGDKLLEPDHTSTNGILALNSS